MSGSPFHALSAIARVDAPVERWPMASAQAPVAKTSFAQTLLDGIDKVSEKANTADALVKAFVVDDSVPPHRVFYALQQSSMSLEMMMQVRNRLVAGYQEIMRLQL